MPTYQIPQAGLSRREAAAQQRLQSREDSGKEMSVRQQQKLQDLNLKSQKLKVFSDQELDRMSEDELRKIVDSGEGSTSDRQRYIEAWLKAHYRANYNDVRDGITTLTYSIASNGIENNPLVTYTDNFIQNTDATLDNDYLILVGQLIGNGTIDGNEEWLYEPWMYNEPVKENVYKLKALAFVSEPRNVRKFGLRKEDGSPLTIDDLKGKTSKEMLQLIDDSQTSGFEGEMTFKELADTYRSTGDNEFEYFKQVIDKLNPENADQLKSTLDLIYKDSSSRRDLLYSDTTRDTFEKDLVKYIQEFIRTGQRSIPSAQSQTRGATQSANYTVKDWLAENNMSPIDLYSQFSRELSTKVSRGRVSKYREYLTKILDSQKLLNQLLRYKVQDDTKESMLNSLVSFLNSFNEIVKKQNRIKKAEADLKTKDETRQLMQDVVDALRGMQLTRDESESLFKEVYRPGMTDEEIIREILRLHGSRNS